MNDYKLASLGVDLESDDNVIGHLIAKASQGLFFETTISNGFTGELYMDDEEPEKENPPEITPVEDPPVKVPPKELPQIQPDPIRKPNPPEFEPIKEPITKPPKDM